MLTPNQAANDPTEQKILAFKAKIEQGAKSDETLSADSAVWYIEAALNYTYCSNTAQQDFYSRDAVNDSVFQEVEIAGDSILFSAIVQNYLKFDDCISSETDRLQGDGFIIDINQVDDGLSCNYCILTTELDKGKGSCDPEVFIDRDWIWGRYSIPGGDCNGNFVGERDLVTELERYYKTCMIDYANTPAKKGYYTGIETEYNTPLDIWMWDSNIVNPQGYTTPLYQELYIHDTQSFWDWCVIEEDCEWYVEHLQLALDLAHAHSDPLQIGNHGKEFIRFMVIPFGNEAGTSYYRNHELWLEYGDFHPYENAQ